MYEISFNGYIQNFTLSKSTVYEEMKRNESKYSSGRPLDLIVPRVNQSRYGLRSIRYERAKIWNHKLN